MKDTQSKEVFNLQNRTCGISRHKISSIFFTFIYYWGIFAPLDPDPAAKSMGIRIHKSGTTLLPTNDSDPVLRPYENTNELNALAKGLDAFHGA
jgi:hypothetical protein